MSDICSKISQNFTLDCANPSVGGVSETFYIFNFDDFKGASYTFDPSNSQAIDSLITLGSGITGFKIEGYTNTVRPLFDASRVEGRPSYKHTISFQVAGDDANANLFAKRLMSGKFVCIVATNSNAIKVYGSGTGLEMPDQTAQDYYASNASYTIQLTTNDETLEVAPPFTYLGAGSPYDFATAKAEIEALILS